MRLSALIVVACWLTVSGRSIQHLRNSTGTCQSPNYPDPYDSRSSNDCEITVRPGFGIKVIFTSFDVGDSYDRIQGPCINDFVAISDASGVIGRFCGNSYLHSTNAPRMNQWLYSKNNVMRIHFESGSSNKKIESTGFSAEYAETDIDECAIQRHKKYFATEDWFELMTCDHICINTLGSYRCSCRRGFQLHQNRHTCIAKFCENQVLTDLQGDIMSPDYPASYAKLSNCAWDIKVPVGFFINLKFSQHFYIEKHVDQGCVYDILTIHFNTSSDTFCGRTPPHNGNIWYLNTNESRIEFATDFSMEKMGFQLHYDTTRIKCLKHPQAPVNGLIRNPKRFYEFEDNVTFSCNIGYELPIGNSSVIFCQSNGEWDAAEPICKIKSCGIPEHLIAVKYSSIENFQSKVFTYKEKVTVLCDAWYEQRSGYSTWQCEDSKNWTAHSGHKIGGTGGSGSSLIPVCRPKCGKRLVDDDKSSAQNTGKEVKRDGGWPWMAFVDLGGTRTGSVYCGGTLVDEETVVTAAHCINDLEEDRDAEVWLGLRKRKTDNFNFTQKFVVPANRRHVYPSFKTVSLDQSHYSFFDGDIAILKLGRPVNFSFYVHPICLPFDNRAKNLAMEYQRHRKNAVVTGWGKNAENELSDTLLKVRLGIVSSTICQANYNNEFGEGVITITSNMICAGFEYGSNRRKVSDTCQADSGGPLMTNIGPPNSAIWYLSGIVSFGDERKGCGKGRTYGVYTDVSKFDDFIGRHTFNIDV